jgi:hypothetical protein
MTIDVCGVLTDQLGQVVRKDVCDVNLSKETDEGRPQTESVPVNNMRFDQK